MSPIAGVIFLGMQQQICAGRCRIGFGTEISSIGNALLVINHKLVHDRKVLSGCLLHQMLWPGALRPAVLHVVMKIRAWLGRPFAANTVILRWPVGLRKCRSLTMTCACAPPKTSCVHNEVFPPRLETKAIRFPSGDQRGATLSKSPYESGNASPPCDGITHSWCHCCPR